MRVKQKTPVETVPEVQHVIGRAEAALEGQGRVLVRYSGTEPLLRIMIEGPTQTVVDRWAEDIAVAVRTHLC